MKKRYLSIWFRHLKTDWFTIRQPHLSNVPFVLRSSSHGKMLIAAANTPAEINGIFLGMALADARVILPDLEVLDDITDLPEKLLGRLAEWCIRFAPIVGIDPPDGLLLDVSGCPHLWGGDQPYVAEIERKLNTRGYDVRIAMADTIGVAWGVARFGKESLVVEAGKHIEALFALPPEALRLEVNAIDRLHKLGLHQINQFIRMSRASLRRRLGQHFIMRLDMALGQEMETIKAVLPPEPYQERLPCMEPIITAIGIEIALKELLNTLCSRLRQEQKGLRSAIFKGYRVDGKVEQVEVGTNRASYNERHLFKLFEIKLATIEPALGIELFTIEAQKVEDYYPQQEKMWEGSDGLEDPRLSELLDRLAVKIGSEAINRYVPEEHYWPERSFRPSSSLDEKLTTTWRTDKLRPLQLLAVPERIEVTAPIPDYPPMLFRRKGKLHQIVKADGPERIEQEWWIQQGQHRDYYKVEDVEGHRYWIFRLGHYHDEIFQWFIHGFYA